MSHLDRTQTINLGSFYTPKNIVNLAYAMLESRLDLDKYLLLDSTCGSGDFFIKHYNYLGVDIDKVALQAVPRHIKTIHANALSNVSRKAFGIDEKQPLIIIGNPPYNDKTSLTKNTIKTHICDIDKQLSCRDLGIAFLRSYAVLQADFVCVLHPLSYLIKRANFNALSNFKECYRLIDSLIISSEVFAPKSSTFFPIIIALYERSVQGMDFSFIQNYNFKVDNGSIICLNRFDFITNYVCKYPNPKDTRKEVAYFHTLRDINALKRNKTFLPSPTNHSIRVFSENLAYYYYIHHFKYFAHRLPYYFGNFDIFIDNKAFLKVCRNFLQLERNAVIEDYFDTLFKDFVR